MPRFNDNYFARRQAAEIQSGQKTYNIQQAAREKFGMKTDWEVAQPVEQREKRDTEPSYSSITAPTTNPARPRATKLAYSREAQKLVVKFRGSKGNENNGPWIEYNDVPIEMWNDLKASNSTGLYLKHSGLDAYPWGNFDPTEMPPETRVMFNS
jgi:hypothetical protein